MQSEIEVSERASRLDRASEATAWFSSSAGRLQRIRWDNLIGLIVVHAAACLAPFPWFFSWTGLLFVIPGSYLFSILGINLGYHRLLTHRSLACPRWLERVFVVLGVCCMQDSPSIWVATHRRHHQFSDTNADPHSPTNNVLWGYVGWILVKQEDLKARQLLERYARDLMRDPFYSWFNTSDNWLKVVLGSWLLFFASGVLIGALSGEGLAGAVQFGLSVLVWGAFVRTAVVWHITWFANTMDHRWGYRNYDTRDNSRNNLLIAILSGGEGWHNNHHADPTSANHGHRRGEFDPTWLTIRLLMQLGLASEVVQPSRLAVADDSSASVPAAAR